MTHNYVYNTAVFHPAPGKLEELETMWKEEIAAAKENFPGILEYRLSTGLPPAMPTPPGHIHGHGPVVSPSLIQTLVFKDEEASKQYGESAQHAAFKAKIVDGAMMKQQPDMYVMTEVAGFDRKG